MTAPFEKGDRVVRITEPEKPIAGMHKDHIYTVIDVWYCCEHVGWRIQLAEIEHNVGKAIKAGFKVNCSPGTPSKHRIYKCGWKAIHFALVSGPLSDETVESLLNELSKPVRELQPA